MAILVHGWIQSVMKRESGESPEQTRCCKFRMIFRKSACHCRKDGKAPEKKQVRRPANVVHSFLCFREIRYENNELDFSLPVLDIQNPLLFVFSMRLAGIMLYEDLRNL